MFLRHLQCQEREQLLVPLLGLRGRVHHNLGLHRRALGHGAGVGAVPLPFALGLLVAGLRGCFWQSSSEVTFAVNLDAQGGGAFGLGIPNVASLLYRPVFAQALFSDVASEASTNALAISIGR